MGYETKMFVGKKTTFEFEGKIYFQVYAMVDLCKLGSSTALYDLDWKHDPEKDGNPVYFHAPAGDGEAEVTEDLYGDAPKPIPIKHVVAALEKDIKVGDYYRRLHWAHALLKSMQDDSDELSVLLWGY